MALLQIAEPGEAPAPHRHRLAVGIDLGTTNSLVATVRNSIPVVLPDDEGRPLLPSIVRYTGHGSRVGYVAQDAQASDASNTIVSVKRLMGRGLADLADARRFPYRFIDAPGMVQIETRAGVKTPIEVSSEILKALNSGNYLWAESAILATGAGTPGVYNRRLKETSLFGTRWKE